MGEEGSTCHISCSCNTATCKLFVPLKDKMLRHTQFPTYYIACVHPAFMAALHLCTHGVGDLLLVFTFLPFTSKESYLTRFLLLPSLPSIVTYIIITSILFFHFCQVFCTFYSSVLFSATVYFVSKPEDFFHICIFILFTLWSEYLCSFHTCHVLLPAVNYKVFRILPTWGERWLLDLTVVVQIWHLNQRQWAGDWRLAQITFEIQNQELLSSSLLFRC